MSNVVVLKMTNGAELIATRNPGPKYSKVREFHVSQQGVGLIPYIMCNPDAELEFEDGIVAVVKCPAEVEKQYLAATSSIQLLS